MKKNVIKGAIAAGILGSVIFSTTIGEKDNTYASNKLYSLTPDELDAYDEYDYEALLKDYEDGLLDQTNAIGTNESSYPVSAVISFDETTKTKSADTLLDEILGYTDGNSYKREETYLPPKEEETYTLPNNEIPVVTSDESYNNADRAVISYFQEAKNKMQEYLASDDYINLKAKAKSIVVTGIDFLFYDGTIKGFTRKELTEKGKEEIINSVSETFEFIDEYYPGFSESLGSKYNRAKEYLSEKFVMVLDKVKDWLGEDNYNALGEELSGLGSDFSDIGSLLGDIFDEHYQGWKLK